VAKERRAASVLSGTDTDGATKRPGTQALQHGILVLQSFSREEPVLGVNEIARRVGLHKSTVSRILSTLEDQALVERDGSSGQFRLGVGVISLAGPMLANMNVRRVARPRLEELTLRVDETTGLAVWSRGETVIVEQVGARNPVKHTIPIGTRYQAHSGSSGKVFLAHAPPEEVREVFDRGLPRVTERTITDPRRLSEELERVRRLGYAVNDGESAIEEVGVAAPVRDHRDRVVAALLLSAPRYRTPPERIERLGPLVAEAAADVSARLGGPTG
jgi:DNA-binding IclR family transcriptional regulator